MFNLRTFVMASVLALAVLVATRTADASPFAFSTSFNSLSPDESLFGVATLDAGSLKLTSGGQLFAFGAHVIDVGAVATFDSFTASWQSLIGGGTGGGADGYSFNVAADLPTSPTYNDPGEEGSGTGLSVTVDTFFNGFGNEYGIEIRWNGTVLAFLSIPRDDPGDGNYLRKNSFVDASVAVTAAGLATFTYDGNILSAFLPGYSGLLADQIMFGARTGAASDNHWVDDLNISGVIRDDVPAVPEPSTWLLLGTGTAGLIAKARRRKQQA